MDKFYTNFTRIINLITSFLGKGLIELGNEVYRGMACRVSTESCLHFAQKCW